MKALGLFAVAAFAAVAASGARGHHSPAAYDMQTQVTVEGIVTAYEWGNPHVYISVRDPGSERVWTVEAFASTAMKQYGWSAATLALGDRVAVAGNPGRNPASSVLFLRSMRTADALLFDAAAALTPASSPPTGAARAPSLSGTWSTLLGPAFFRLLAPVSTLPMTPKGAAAMADYRDTASPAVECVPFTAPIYMILPGFRSIELRDDVVLIRGEDAAVERIVHLNVATHDGAAASVQGHSIGRWEGGALVVDSARFAEHRLGNAGGLPSGPAKHVIERFELNPDGGLTYTFVLEDPEYLAEPVTGAAQWLYRPEASFAATPCSLDNARRFLAE